MSTSTIQLPNYMLSQELNNYAATLIQERCYSKAMSSLAKAIELSKTFVSMTPTEAEDDSLPCRCRHCNLDACIKYSASGLEPTKNHDENSPGYIHRNPIYIESSCLSYGHSLGPLVPLLLTFNLALTYHLRGLDSTGNSANRQKCLTKARKLYQLSYRIYDDQLDFSTDDDNSSSLWFEMIVANNLGQLYKSMDEHKKHTETMEDLMSIIMIFVDCHQPVLDTREFALFMQNATNRYPGICAGAA